MRCLLLRSETSTRTAFTIFDSWFPALAKLLQFAGSFHQRLPAALRSLTFLFVGLPLLSIALIIIKVVATALTLISAPRESLLAIPANWLRIALATDLRHPPEFLPGVESAAEDAPDTVHTIRYAELPRLINAATSGRLSQTVAFLAIRASTVLYRLILKSTSLVYFPLM